MKKLRWGVIGAGGIADRRAIPGLMKCDNAELVAVMELDLQVSRDLCEKYHAKRAYDKELDLLKDPEVDAVYIASPVKFHAEQAKMAADHGKHILIEKPLAMTSAEGQSILDYCENKGVKLAVGFMMRFGSYVSEIKKAVQQGKIGDLVSGFAQFTCWYPDIPDAWRQSRSSSGGGALMDMGIHCIDLIQYITGSPVIQVAALHDTLTFNYEVEDSSSVTLRLANGAICTVQSNFNIPDEAAKWRLEFFGTKGRLVGDNVIGQEDSGSLDAIFMDDVGGYDAKQNKKEIKATKIDVTYGDMFQREIWSFSNSVLKYLPLEVPAADAIQIQKIAEAAYRSNDEKRIIDI